MDRGSVAVTVFLIVIAAIIIIVLLVQLNGVQNFTLSSAPVRASNIMKETIQEKPILDTNKNNETVSKNQKAATVPVLVEKPVGIKNIDKQILYADSIFDLFTPKEDTLKLYGVTPMELSRLVQEYRKEHTYEVEKAPTTLTFNLNRWEEANDAMQENASHNTVEVKDYQEGLVDRLYKQESV